GVGLNRGHEERIQQQVVTRHFKTGVVLHGGFLSGGCLASCRVGAEEQGLPWSRLTGRPVFEGLRFVGAFREWIPLDDAGGNGTKYDCGSNHTVGGEGDVIGGSVVTAAGEVSAKWQSSGAFVGFVDVGTILDTSHTGVPVAW